MLLQLRYTTQHSKRRDQVSRDSGDHEESREDSGALGSPPSELMEVTAGCFGWTVIRFTPSPNCPAQREPWARAFRSAFAQRPAERSGRLVCGHSPSARFSVPTAGLISRAAVHRE